MSPKKISKTITPLITVVIPTYNRQDLIGKTLDSVIAQTYGNWECIVVDDLSTDNTANVVHNYIKKDPRISFIQMPTKGNANVSRNKGITLAKGNYIAMLDSDDTWLEHHLESRLACILKTKADGVYGGTYECIGNTRNEKQSRKQHANESIFEFVTFSSVPKQTSGLFFKVEPLRAVMWDENLGRHQDFDLLIRFLSSYTLAFDAKITVELNMDPTRNSVINAKGTSHNNYLDGCIQYFEKYKTEFYNHPYSTFLYLISFVKLLLKTKNWKYLSYYSLETIQLNFNISRFFKITKAILSYKTQS